MELGKDHIKRVATTPEEFFPELRQDVLRLRETDPIFEAVCRDLELIAKLIQEARSEDTDLTECLEGLKDEIHGALKRNSA